MRSLDHIAARNNYYTIDLEDGRKYQGIEKMFAILEGAAGTILEKLAAGQRQLSSEDREVFSAFLAFGWSRVPKFRSEVEESATVLLNDYAQNLARDPSKFAQTVAKVEEETGSKLGDWEKMREAILGKNIEVVARPELSLEIMALNFEFLAGMISGMRWSFRETDSINPLVTSDNPVVLNNPSMLEGEGPLTPAALEVTFPISPELLFVATWDGHAGTGPMRPHLARQINKLMALAADKYIYSSTQIPAIVNYLSEPRRRLINLDLLKRVSGKVEAK
jgi:hypothetical protein